MATRPFKLASAEEFIGATLHDFGSPGAEKTGAATRGQV
jgi:hypothetical protein